MRNVLLISAFLLAINTGKLQAQLAAIDTVTIHTGRWPDYTSTLLADTLKQRKAGVAVLNSNSQLSIRSFTVKTKPDYDNVLKDLKKQGYKLRSRVKIIGYHYKVYYSKQNPDVHILAPVVKKPIVPTDIGGDNREGEYYAIMLFQINP